MAGTRRKLALIAIAAIFVTLLSQNTLAYYSLIGKATNVVTSGDIQLVIHEYTADGSPFPEEGVYIIPGDIVGKTVVIENVCGHPFYLRVRLVNGIDSQELSAEEVFRVNLNESAWTSREDGCIYYNEILQPGESTPPVFTQVEIVGDKVDQNYIGKTLTLTVTAQAVQSEHNPAQHPWEAAGWPALDGEVTG
ncbi:MAG: hypothetical protein IJ960_03285 [Oscillospiraceae bacterium]|nr:hypothetical protein [Oscillospiraceae bacterium]